MKSLLWIFVGWRQLIKDDFFLLGQKVQKIAKKGEDLIFWAEILRWLKFSHIYRVLRQTLLVPSQFRVADSVSDMIMA